MKKIRQFSFHKKKVPSPENGNGAMGESDPPVKSPVKTLFGTKIRKKLFTGKIFQRSLSLPEERLESTTSHQENVKEPDIVLTEANQTELDVTLRQQTSHSLNDATLKEIGDHRIHSYVENHDDDRINCDPLTNLDNGLGDCDFSTTSPKRVYEDVTDAVSDRGQHSAKSAPGKRLVSLPPLEFSPIDHPKTSQSNAAAYQSSLECPLSPAIITNDLQSLTHPVVPKNIPRSTITSEFQKLAHQGWYWGPLTRTEAEEKLFDLPNGSFLVRDSSDERYLLSLSFRSFGRTLHTRIEHSTGRFSFYANTDYQSYHSVVELVTESVRDSQEAGVFCYSRSRSPHSPTFPVRLTKPVSRLSQVRQLQYLCRFVIRQYTRIDHIEKLPLPNPVKGYLNQSYF